MFQFNFKDIVPFLSTQEEIDELERRKQEEGRYARYCAAVPERYRAESFGTFKISMEWQRSALADCRNFVQDVKAGAFRTLILLGTVGTGKTHLACGILRELGGLYKETRECIEELRQASTFGAKESEEDVLGRYARARLLVLDEIGRGSGGTSERYMLYNVINCRYNGRKPLVLVSNMDKQAFLSYIGIAAADRLNESARIVDCNGESYRGKLKDG